jgi:hypothetical protein
MALGCRSVKVRKLLERGLFEGRGKDSRIIYGDMGGTNSG